MAKDYIDIADGNYRAFLAILPLEEIEVNDKCVNAHQVVEKYLKQICIDFAGIERDDETLKTHNIKKLCRLCREYLPQGADTKKLSAVSDYYFVMRYPGDDYFDGDEYDLEDAKEAVYECRKIMEQLYPDRHKVFEKNIDLSENTAEQHDERDER